MIRNGPCYECGKKWWFGFKYTNSHGVCSSYCLEKYFEEMRYLYEEYIKDTYDNVSFLNDYRDKDDI